MNARDVLARIVREYDEDRTRAPSSASIALAREMLRGGDFLEIYIEGLPDPPNATRRRHYMQNAGIAAKWRNDGRLAGLEARQRIPEGWTLPLLSASLEYVFRLTAERGDLDNLVASAKPIVDGLRDAGLFLDDSVGKLPLVVARWERAPRKGVVFRIRPLIRDQIGLFE